MLPGTRGREHGAARCLECYRARVSHLFWSVTILQDSWKSTCKWFWNPIFLDHTWIATRPCSRYCPLIRSFSRTTKWNSHPYTGNIEDCIAGITKDLAKCSIACVYEFRFSACVWLVLFLTLLSNIMKDTQNSIPTASFWSPEEILKSTDDRIFRLCLCIKAFYTSLPLDCCKACVLCCSALFVLILLFDKEWYLIIQVWHTACEL